MFTLTIYFIALNVSVEFVLIYRPHPVDAGCRNTDADGIGLDAIAQLCF
jgi:hypothetical protein